MLIKTPVNSSCTPFAQILIILSFKRSKAPYAADNVPLPDDPDAPFHGFPVSMMDHDAEPRNFEGWDLTTPFR